MVWGKPQQVLNASRVRDQAPRCGQVLGIGAAKRLASEHLAGGKALAHDQTPSLSTRVSEVVLWSRLTLSRPDSWSSFFICHTSVIYQVISLQWCSKVLSNYSLWDSTCNAQQHTWIWLPSNKPQVHEYHYNPNYL